MVVEESEWLGGFNGGRREGVWGGVVSRSSYGKMSRKWKKEVTDN